MPVHEMLRHLLGALTSPPTSGRYRRLLWAEDDLLGHKRRRSSSDNHAKIANGIRLRFDPHGAAAWWVRLLEGELQGIEDDGEGREFMWMGNEPFSGTYWAPIWLAELVALNLLRWTSGRTGLQQRALELLQRACKRHAAWYAVSAIPRAVEKSENGRVIWDGPATVSTGGRSKPEFRKSVNMAFCEVTDSDYQIDLRSEGEEIEHEICQNLERVGLTEREKASCKEAIARTNDPFEIDDIRRMTRGTKHRVPIHLFRTEGHQLYVQEECPSFGSSSPFACLAPVASASDDQGSYTAAESFQFAHPYPRQVVKGGDPEMGRGQVWLDDGELVCSNLSDAEALKKTSKHRYARRLPLPGAMAQKLKEVWSE